MIIETARRLANPYIVGETSIRARGIGVEPEDYRDYMEGDDIRFVDWKLSSRAVGPDGEQRILLRERRAERSMKIVVVVDLSSSMMYKSKMITALHVLSFISSMALGLKDRILLILAGRRIRSMQVSPETAPHVLVASVCRSMDWGGELDLRALAGLLVRLGRQPVLLLSDTAHEVEEIGKFMRTIKSPGRGVGLVFCSDPSEVRPPEGSALLVGSEGGISSLEGIRRVVEEHRSRLFALMKAFLVPHIEIISLEQARRFSYRLMMLYLVVRNASFQ